MTDTIQDQLTELAYELTDNFCYGCYQVVEGDNCPKCGSDDFMRHLDGVGVEYGTEWVVDSLIKEHCDPVDGEQLFEEMLDECYPPYNAGYGEYTAGQIVRELDPTTFRCGVADYLSDEDQFMEVDGEYYQVYDIEQMIEELS
jgi:hypothetical protein